MLGQASPPNWLSELLTTYDQLLSRLGWFAVALLVVYLVGVLVVVPVLTRLVSARNRNNPTIESATRTYLRVALAAFATLTGVIVAGYGNLLSDSAVIIAALTFTLGIAGQQVFGSLISGMFLVADPDFNVGDWIEWQNGEGTIEAIHFRVTRVRTPDNGTIAVPNTELTNGSLSRPYGRERYRLTEQLFVPYAADTEQALLELRRTAEDADAVLDDPPPETRVLDLGENAVTLQAEFWVEDPMDNDLVTVRSNFRRRVKRRFDEAGITLAPPSARLLSGEISLTEQSSGSAGDD
ncbi:MAG: mechanosensitive ion channel family protein [Halolamina sp.]